MEPNSEQQSRPGGESQTIAAVHWFIPLLIPLTLPESPIRSTHSIRKDNEAPGKGSLIISILPREVETQLPGESESSFSAMEASLPPEHRRPATDHANSDLKQSSTVLEVVAVFQDGAEPSEEELPIIFDLALEEIRDIQRAHYIATKHAAPLVTREQLPSIIAMLRRQVSPENAGFPGEPGVYIAHPNTALRTTRPDRLNKSQLGAFHTIVQGGAGVFAGYVDFIREATVGLDYYGDYRGATLNAATASETFLDTLLIHLDWEERRSPEETATKFQTHETIASRVRTFYAGPLRGGSWELVGDTPVARWYRQCMSLRNRIIHSGYSPSWEEAREAIESMIGLQTHVADLLTASGTLRKYLHTAYSLTGYPGLERRGRLSKRVSQELECLAEDRKWIAQVQRYSRAVMMARARKDGLLPLPDVMSSKLHIIYHPDGVEQWVLLHEDSGLAAIVKAELALLTTQTETTVVAMRPKFLKQAKEANEPISVGIFASITPKDIGEWRPSHEIIPSRSAVRR